MNEPAKVIWRPVDDGADTPMAGFAAIAGDRWQRDLGNWDKLHAWSVTEREEFWQSVWDQCGLVGTMGSVVLEQGDAMPGARFFPEARLNFAENLLAHAGEDDEPALIFRSEAGDARRMSWGVLREDVARTQQALARLGVGPGDRVAAMMPNMPETIVAMLAAAGLGAVFSSCSPDFGVKGVLDRFGQIEPTVLIGCAAYAYGGKIHDTRPKLAEVAEGLPSLTGVLVVPYKADDETATDGIPKSMLWQDALDAEEADTPTFLPLPFSHPLYVLFSSGTTGAPKCIVHSAGGTLLQHAKEHRLHCGLTADDTLFYFSTCGWMMWNWLVSGLQAGATLVLFDGSPFHPGPEILFDVVAQQRVTHFGTSAKFIDAINNEGLRPRDTHDLSALRMLMSTGSPLVPEGFDYVMEAIKPDVHLASISGGTDIVSCFVLGTPLKPVRRGEIQAAGLGMDSQVWDEQGRRVTGDKGELVCARAFPAMPIGFWNDDDGARYRAAYFERFPGVWHHGDFAEETESGGFIIHGRSDATLNPGGVRIGTAEIYRQVEQLPEITEALVIGQDWQGDTRVVLFVVLAKGAVLDDALETRIRSQIRTGASPRHVPAKIIAVADIPRTKSGKITELAVRDVVHGREVKNREALANPEALDLFRDLDALKT
ncbi:acetoacetate--CoA ligase [Pyruvatibacter mobilis]|uniref:acetoacetate--CoA ligase n=1 Tax=Pyruvatibacter mobilis TaxID=1712261 RepID=UPI003BA9AB07